MSRQIDPIPAERLREARERAGFMTAASAARAYGWIEGTYRHHENGTRGVPAKAASIYAKAFGVTVDWIFDGSSTAKNYAEAAQAVLYTDSEAIAGTKYSAIANRSFGALMLRLINMSDLEGEEPTPTSGNFFALDASVVEQVAPGRASTPLTFEIVKVDQQSKSSYIAQGAILLVDLHAAIIKRQGALVLYSYAGFPGVATIFRHPDDTVELMHLDGLGSSIRVPLRDLRVWGHVLWIGQPPR